MFKPVSRRNVEVTPSSNCDTELEAGIVTPSSRWEGRELGFFPFVVFLGLAGVYD